MGRVEGIDAKMRRTLRGIPFRDLCKVCDFHQGEVRQAFAMCPFPLLPLEEKGCLGERGFERDLV